MALGLFPVGRGVMKMCSSSAVHSFYFPSYSVAWHQAALMEVKRKPRMGRRSAHIFLHRLCYSAVENHAQLLLQEFEPKRHRSTESHY